ncbi:MAG: hypothetical protein V4864_16140 [Pseudomonadota bacterium]
MKGIYVRTIQSALAEMAQQARDEALAADKDAKFKEVALRFALGPLPRDDKAA